MSIFTIKEISFIINKQNQKKTKRKKMKKVILILSVVGLLTACGSSKTEETAPVVDSTAVTVDTVKVEVVDTTVVATPTVVVEEKK